MKKISLFFRKYIECIGKYIYQPFNYAVNMIKINEGHLYLKKSYPESVMRSNRL